MSLSILAFGMTALVGAMVLAIVALARSAGLRGWPVAAVLVGWLTLTGLVAATGALHLDGGPPRVFVPVVLALIGTVWVVRGRAGHTLVAAAPPGAIVALQAFRVAVELVLWGLFCAHVVPIQMTFEGRNFDILVGATAIPVALIAYGTSRQRPRLALVWHVASLALLVNIVVIAVTSAPGPLRVFMAEPANRIIGTFPYVWLPTFLVPAALAGHIIGLRQALRLSAAR